VSGLKGDLRTEVQALKSSTLTEAIRLARLYEARNQWTRNLFGINIKEPNPPPLSSSALTRPQGPVMKCLSLTKLQVRHDRGLCFNCDERFIQDHRCKKLFLLKSIYPEEEEPKEDHHGCQEDTIAPLEFC
jgi:hypothetical protein